MALCAAYLAGFIFDNAASSCWQTVAVPDEGVSVLIAGSVNDASAGAICADGSGVELLCCCGAGVTFDTVSGS